MPILSSFGSDSLAYFMTSQLSPPSIRIWGCTGAQVNDSWVLNQSTIAGDIAFENGKLYLAYLKQGNGYNTLTLAVNSASGWNSTALYTLSDSGIPPVALAVSAGEYHILTQDGIYLLYFNRSHFEKSSIAYMNGSGGADIALDEGKAVFAFIYNDRIAFANEYRYYENEGRAIYEYTPHIIDSENYTSGTAVKFFIPQRGPDTGKWVVIYSTSYTFPTTLIAKSSDKGQTWEIKSIGGGTLLDAAVDSEGKYHIIVRQSTRALVYFTPNSIAGWDMYNLGDYNENNGAGIAVTSSGEVHILFNTYNSSSYYNYFSHAVKGSPPVPVSSLNAMPLSKRVVLSWNDTQNENVLGYSIYRGTSASTLTLIANVSNNTHTYNDTDVSNEVQYYYSVKAYNLFGDSDYSQVVSAVPSAAYGKPPLSPRNLTALQKAYKGVVLQWEPPVWDGGADITSYNIYRGESPDSLSYFSNTTSLTYPDTTAAGNRYYYYMVKAVNQFGE
ncbi:MAG: fibronectin type III domain-containing protein [Thermoplasmata archaeon]